MQSTRPFVTPTDISFRFQEVLGLSFLDGQHGAFMTVSIIFQFTKPFLYFISSIIQEGVFFNHIKP